MKDVGQFYGHLFNFTAISFIFMAMWYTSWSFWYIFPVFGMLWREKSGNPGVRSEAAAAVTDWKVKRLLMHLLPISPLTLYFRSRYDQRPVL
jgi:hypothetical protein